MRKLVCSFLFFALLLANPFGTTVAALPNKATLSKKEVSEPLTRKQLEQKLGRKLKLKERIALWVLKKKIKKQKKEKLKTHPLAITASIFSVLGMAFPFGTFGIPIAITLSIIALAKIRKSKGKWGGKGVAMFALILAILIVITLAILGVFALKMP